ncbi:MAG: zinc ABC transporter substrate-binding protein [Clostridia bacterium]|nr:zinc ABC transporter substrate-binding protein [Clostridia bacterium]
MKKILALTLCVLVFAGILSGCSINEKSDKIEIVTTIFPEYDWVREILGENNDRVNITMLIDSGADLHSYQPTADDIVKVATCDLFIYVGGESDAWVADVLKTAKNPDMIVVNLLDVLGDKVKEEEVKEGMEAEDEHDHDHDEEEEHDHDHEHEHHHDEDEPEFDEHVWLSLKNAVDLTGFIAEKIKTLDPDHADYYAANTSAYVAKLQALDAKYAAAVNEGTVKTLLFGDRFPFRYLVDDYGLDYFAAFVGCSAESEASFETIVFLSNKVDELHLKAIMQIESADGKIANTIKNQTQTKDQTVLTLDSMQSVTAKDVKNGTTYLGVMERNLEVLKEALK